MATLIKIYGERNTNTNYLSRLISLNLTIEELSGVVPPRIKELQNKLPGNELIRDAYFLASYGNNLGWKHAAINWEKMAKANIYKKHRVAIVTLTKNPYSWLLSLYRKPYHQYYKEKPSFIQFLQQPWKTVFRENAPRVVSNPIQLWNIKNASYLQSKSALAIHLKTEDTFVDPKSIIKRIGDALEIGTCDDFKNVTSSTKDNTKNFAYYKDYYLNNKWQSEIPSEAVEFINHELDTTLMDEFGYNYIKAEK